MKHILTALMLTSAIGCHAEGQDPTQESPKKTKQSAPSETRTTGDELRELFRKAAKAAGTIKDNGKPRKVQRGASPEVVIQSSNIIFNGKPLKFGTHIDEWKKVLGGSPRTFQEYPTIFVWDDLGIQIVTANEQVTKVVQMAVYSNQKPKDPYAGMVTVWPDGSPNIPTPDFNPKHIFTGYFELDGAGIDDQTKVWEVNALAKRQKKFHCMASLLRCHAATEDGKNSLVFFTDEKRQKGLIYFFTIHE
jgi:hypothetical protein